SLITGGMLQWENLDFAGALAWFQAALDVLPEGHRRRPALERRIACTLDMSPKLLFLQTRDLGEKKPFVSEFGVRLDQHGRLVAGNGRLFDVRSGKVLVSFDDDVTLLDLVFKEGEALLITLNGVSQQLTMWKYPLGTREVVGKLQECWSRKVPAGTSAVLSPNGTFVVTLAGSKKVGNQPRDWTIDVWDPGQERVKHTFRLTSEQPKVEFSRDERLCAVVPMPFTSGESRLVTCDERFTLPKELSELRNFRAISFSSDSTTVAVLASGPEVLVYKATEESEPVRIDVEGATSPAMVCLTSNGRQLMTGLQWREGWTANAYFSLWNTAVGPKGRLIRKLPANGYPTCLGFHPNDLLFATGGFAGSVFARHASSQGLGVQAWHSSPVRALTFSGDGLYLASTGDAELKVVRITDYQEVTELTKAEADAHQEHIAQRRVYFRSSDDWSFGSTRAAVSTSRRETKKSVKEGITAGFMSAPLLSTLPVACMATSADGRWHLLTEASASRVGGGLPDPGRRSYLWDARLAEVRSSPILDQSLFNDAQFSSDGQQFMTIMNTHCTLWDTETALPHWNWLSPPHRPQHRPMLPSFESCWFSADETVLECRSKEYILRKVIPPYTHSSVLPDYIAATAQYRVDSKAVSHPLGAGELQSAWNRYRRLTASAK
ncbi:MAG TPA: WD40 repeat domain-containing protein, partial [Caulifigura sp.]|nr:WD40 repeat domain-containing protein [Caulifigura sp.]